MTLPTKIGVLSAITALLVSAGGITLLSFMLDGISDIGLVPITIALTTPLAAFLSVWLVSSRRYPKRRPVLGPIRGGLIALMIFAAGVFVHAVFRPGAAGVLVSFVGQFVVAFLTMGWIAVIAGCAVGILGESLAESNPPNTSLKSVPARKGLHRTR